MDERKSTMGKLDKPECHSVFAMLWIVVTNVLFSILQFVKSVKIALFEKTGKDMSEDAPDNPEVQTVPESVNFHFTRQCNYECEYWDAFNKGGGLLAGAGDTECPVVFHRGHFPLRSSSIEVIYIFLVLNDTSHDTSHS